MHINLKDFRKKFVLPDGYQPPTILEHHDLYAEVLGRKHVDPDMEAANSSIELIHRTRGGKWPKETLTREVNELDLVWHEREFRNMSSFAYAVTSRSDNEYIGCFYIYPIGSRGVLTEELATYDADVSWWVTENSYKLGRYKELHDALRVWLQEFPFENVYYSNKEIPG